MHLHRFKKVWQLPRAALKRFVSDLLRIVLLTRRPGRMAKAGFVLPTTVLLTLMVVLTATALTYRAFTRSEQAIVQREQQVISNAATPAIDRAKSKIEFLFRQDPRFPSGLPSSDILYDLMSTRLAAGRNSAGYTGRVPLLVGGANNAAVDPYTLPDETRVDINNDGLLDNAWSFLSAGRTIIYSVLVDDAVATAEGTAPAADESRLRRPYVTANLSVDAPANQTKANALITRTGPLATTEAVPGCPGAVADQGWQVVSQGNASNLQKNFQVNAFVANGDGGPGQTFETLEFQQSRQASRASKWGAWFRYDLDIFPGADFNWNGAMHTDSSLFVNRDTVHLHMVSSHNSCVYSREASEITVGTDDTTGFQGQVVKGNPVDDSYPNGNNPRIHVFNGAGEAPRTGDTLTNANHSVENGRPSDISANAMALFTRDRLEHMRTGNWQRRADWDTDANIFGELNGGRTINSVVARPFVDDFYRADNRWGPKPRYDSRTAEYDVSNVAGRRIGEVINGQGGLTDRVLGLDGYWERQAIRSGMRIVVGQRLELGNNNAWNNPNYRSANDTPNPIPVNQTLPNDGDPLYPAAARPAANARFGGNHQYLQRRSLQDNLAAVQGMVVYHYQKENGQFPAACMASTAHPGTRQSIVNSRTFGVYGTTGIRRVDFFNGVGTNGWEFALPTTFDTEGEFRQQISPTAPLGIALRNLANFAGDPSGGAPSFPAFQDGFVHPFPYQSMWGDFSPLRRILQNIDSAGAWDASRYDNLSWADKSTLHSAACTISLLAYNLDSEYQRLEQALLAPPVNNFQNISTQLRNGISDMIDFIETGADSGNKMLALFRRLANEGSYKPGLPDGSGNYPPNARWVGDPNNIPNPITAAALRNWIDPNVSTVLPARLNADGTPNSPSICQATGATADAAGFQRRCDVAEFFDRLTRQDWLIMLDELTNATQANINAIETYSRIITTARRAVRDRELGFREGQSTYQLRQTDASKNAVPWDETSGFTRIYVSIRSERFPFRTNCSPNIFTDTIASGGGGQDDQLALTLVACSPMGEEQQEPVRFPSLYYLFPLVDHSLIGTGAHEQPGTARPAIPGDRQWIDRMTAYNNDYIVGVRGLTNLVTTNTAFRVVRTAATVDPERGFSVIAATPKPDNDLTSWQLPVTSTTGAITTANVDDQASAFKVNWSRGATSGVLRMPFLDKGIYDGREQLNTRVLDVDLDALITQRVKGVTGADFWLTANRDNQAEGVVYAFREDAVREDEIVRPVNGSAADCTGITAVVPRRFRIETEANCRMRVSNPSTAVLANNQDPPLSPQGISLKPVDFIPDPERRPHGFRLRTASGNNADFSGTNYARDVGMTFVTDNSVYIQGDFNLHSTTGARGGIVEEFTQTLWDQTTANFRTRFYGGRTRAGLNTANFAVLTQDHWRPVEILSDSVYILSGTFRDGAVEDGFLRAEPGAIGGGTSSYMNQNRPRFAADLAANAVIRAQRDELDGLSDNRPIYIDRNGTYYLPGVAATDAPRPFFNVYNNNNATSGWMEFATGDGIRRLNNQQASDTFVNATFVSGIIPKRPNQSYGGLHNYPRFLERWTGQNLYIAGSFIQLNFSTGSTGPYDQDSWEEGVDPVATEPIGYYDAPNRRWGYDVGLLYVPPAPAARRFVTIGAPRSEYYRELPADDPYIVNLRCARGANGQLILTGLCPA